MFPSPVPYWVELTSKTPGWKRTMEASRGDKTICLPFESEKHYNSCMRHAKRFRQTLTELYNRHPELFPARFGEGFSIDDKRVSERQQLAIRRIELHATKEKFSERPSFM